MINLLVTGADGQLGRSLRDLETSFPEFRFLFTDYKELDITSLQSIHAFFKGNKIDYIINCAAYTAVDRAESEPDKARLLNTIAVSYLAQAAGFFGATMIHISTDYVFDGSAVSPISESTETSPLGVYGRTKLDGEAYVLGYSKGIVIRTAWLYSEYGANFVKTMRRLGAEKEEIGVVCDQVGTPTYAGDLSAAIMQIIVQGAEKYGLYHFSNEGSCSWAEFATEIMACSN
ncbi:MAG: dTDP-4-dehydrorhamnose reductase, partial [Rikenellaceae bacterium]